MDDHPSSAGTLSRADALAPQEIVRDFLIHLDDPQTCARYLADDVVWENVGSVAFPTVRGRERTLELLERMFRPCSGWRVDFAQITADGPYVQTERTDTVMLGPRSTEVGFWVCGRFEVRDGRIVAWRDRFDTAAFAFALLSGGVRAAAGALLRR